jgi:glutathione S-transferase
MARILHDLCGREPELRFSPYCWRAKLALAHKGLAFETAPTPFTAIARIAPGARTVPILDDDGRLVHDSFAIALYLEEAYPHRPSLFGGEGGVAAARFVEQWVMTALHPLILRMIVRDIHDALAEEDRAYFRESREARLGDRLEEVQEGVAARLPALLEALEPMRRTLKHHAWLGGEGPLFSDYVVAGTLLWLTAIHGRLPLKDDDPVAAWFERCLDLHGGLARQARRAA